MLRQFSRVAKKRVYLSLFLILLFFLCTRPTSRHETTHVVFVTGKSPRLVWDFVADLNHLRLTNPGLKNIEIVADVGIYPEWHYSAILTEVLPTVGEIKLHTDFQIKPAGRDFLIVTYYYSCKFFMCVYVNSSLTFKTADKQGTTVTEVLVVRMPFLLNCCLGIRAVEEYHKTWLENIKRHQEAMG
ncbi:uncharacterized protein LOC143237187 [Tachypleus tridentatus]|uniref:uncharacterized protein LOC143237187 n=1 Tax=Tachypleus tridentatus TaxID=6853 RepID=UPI003FD6AD8A